MLTLVGGQVECLWDEVLPVEVRELPEDLARLDRVLSDPVLLVPIALAWEQTARGRGRPSIAMGTFVRLMVVKQRTGWGYETLVREVSDSLHLRRFCLIAIDQRVPDESTVRKLARRLGAGVVEEITRMVIEKAKRETRFRPRAARIDSTVVEADIRYPVRRDARASGRAGCSRGRAASCSAMIKGKTVRVRDRSRSIGKTVRAISKTLARRTGEAKAQVMALNEQRRRSDRRSGQRGAATRRGSQSLRSRPWRARQAARGRQAGEFSPPLPEGRRADRLVASRTADHRPSGVDRRPRRPADPQGQARQTDRVRVCRADLRGDREHPQRSPRVDPPSRPRAGEPAENTLLPQTATELDRAGIRPREIVLDGGFIPGPTREAFPDLNDEQIQLSGRHEPGSRRTRKRRARYRTGIEGRISHLKRGYGLRRSRLKGHDGMRTWTGWAILAYDLDTLAIRTR